jgi:predicted nuclease of predicted toxin-antitoxin system
MWLLDVNVPKQLVAVLGELGRQAESAESRGWSDLTNGELVEAAVEADFTCVLTRDRLFSESAARTLRRFPDFAVVLVRLPQLRGSQFVEEFRNAWAKDPIEPLPGSVLVQPEMERGRSPLVSIPPFGRGFSRHRGLPIRCGFLEERGSEAAALRSSSR